MTPKPDSNRLNTPARGQGRPLNAFCPLLTHIVTPSVSKNVLSGKNHAQPRSRVLSVDERSFERSTLICLLSVKTGFWGGAASRAFERSFGANPSAKTAPNVLPLMSYPKPPQNRAQNPSAQDQLPTPSPTPSDPTPPPTKRPSTAVLGISADPRQLRALCTLCTLCTTTTRRSRCPSRGSSLERSGSTRERLHPMQEAASYAIPRRQSIETARPVCPPTLSPTSPTPPRLRSLLRICTPKQKPTLTSISSDSLQNRPRPRDKDRHSPTNPKPTQPTQTYDNPTRRRLIKL